MQWSLRPKHGFDWNINFVGGDLCSWTTTKIPSWHEDNSSVRKRGECHYHACFALCDAARIDYECMWMWNKCHSHRFRPMIMNLGINFRIFCALHCVFLYIYYYGIIIIITNWHGIILTEHCYSMDRAWTLKYLKNVGEAARNLLTVVSDLSKSAPGTHLCYELWSIHAIMSGLLSGAFFWADMVAWP